MVLLAGCGGGHPKARPSTDPRVQLSAMVLPKAALGPEAARFVKVGPSGLLTNERRAASDLDPLVSTASLAKAGRISGYALEFGLGHSQMSGAFSRGAGLVEIGTLVELYRDEGSVTRQMRKSLADLRQLVGKPLNLGGTLERAQTFPVRGSAGRAIGIRFTVRIAGTRVHITQVAFRSGPFAGIAVETRADTNDVAAEVTSLAQRLDSQIQRVRTGSA